MLDGVLFFPVTPFGPDGEVDYDRLAEHINRGVAAGPGGVFVACGTGEFHALGLSEFGEIVRRTVETVAGRVPVFAGAGGSLVQAKEFAASAKANGANGILLLPPYLVTMPPAGLVEYTRAVAQTTDLPVIVYNRSNAVFDEAGAVAVAQLPTVIGFKDGTGDLDNVSRIVIAVKAALAGTGKDFLFFNGLPTAEITQQAYRALGVTLYSSATFAFAPIWPWPSTTRWRPATPSSPRRCCASSSTRSCGCATRFPATPCRWSRKACGWRVSPPDRCARRWSTSPTSTAPNWPGSPPPDALS